MTQQEIIENNKLIAGFEGHKIEYGFKKDKVLFLGELVGLEKLKYHDSWDWLMEVVERIESSTKVYEFNISFNDVDKCHFCEITPSNKNTFYIIYTTAETKIEAVYKAVLMFIEWYNEQSK